MNGKIKMYNNEKGFGFIRTDENKDVFFHISTVVEKGIIPEVGNEVEFEVEEGPKGERAKKVTILK